MRRQRRAEVTVLPSGASAERKMNELGQSGDMNKLCVYVCSSLLSEVAELRVDSATVQFVWFSTIFDIVRRVCAVHTTCVKINARTHSPQEIIEVNVIYKPLRATLPRAPFHKMTASLHD